jgi:uncharacterized repeat protein (TIGR03803 family)
MQKKFRSQMTVVLAVLTMALALMPGAWAASNKEAGEAGKMTVTVLYNFGENSQDPQYPQGFIAQGRDGSLYSTTPYGGTTNDGTVYKIAPTGELTVLYELATCRGSSGLTLGTDGNFYGTSTCDGNGYGSVFGVTPDGKLKTLYDFTGQDFDAYPHAPPVQASDGNFYGTTLGSFVGNGGEVYKMTPSGHKTRLFTFDRTDGANPGDPLIQATDGNFYGTTNTGGASGRCEQYGCGTVFKLTPKGIETILHSFNVQNFDAYYPVAPVIEGSDGELYGTAPRGGPKGHGVVFKISRTGKYAIIHSFDGVDGETPQTGLVLATDGNFYGTTEGGGTSDVGVIFRISPGGRYSVVYSLDDTTGAYPSAALLQHTNGKLYGFAGEGGTYNYGTFFSVDLGLGPFAELVSSSGQVGKSIGILGQGFTGTTGVSFDGTSAAFKILSDTYMTATVPQGATSGFVSVITPNGTLKSNKQFLVTH